MRRVMAFIALCLTFGLIFSYVLAVTLAFARLGDERKLFPRFFELEEWRGSYWARTHVGYEFGRVTDDLGIPPLYINIEVARASKHRNDSLPRFTSSDSPTSSAPTASGTRTWNHELVSAAGWPRHCIRGSILPVPSSLRDSDDPNVMPVVRGAVRRPDSSNDLHGSSVIPLAPMPAGLAINTLFWGGIPAALGLTFAGGGAVRRRRRGWCVACGYDLAGSPGACPECGRGVAPSAAAGSAAHAKP